MEQNIIIALKIMGQGMLGIFISILLIMLTIMLIQKFSSKQDNLLLDNCLFPFALEVT